MSLLNDALKRASQSQQELDTVRVTFPSPPATAPEPKAGLGWALPVLVILLIVTTSAFVTLAFFAQKAHPQITTAAIVPPPVQAVATPKPSSPPPISSSSSSSLAAPKPIEGGPALRSFSEGGSPNPAQPYLQSTKSAPPAPAPVSPPRLKVQGITYYNAKWQAIINGQTVYVGDSVNGFRIAAISRNHVSFIAPDGSRKLVPFGE